AVAHPQGAARLAAQDRRRHGGRLVLASPDGRHSGGGYGPQAVGLRNQRTPAGREVMPWPPKNKTSSAGCGAASRRPFRTPWTTLPGKSGKASGGASPWPAST